MSMEGWQSLSCTGCKSKEFLPVVELIFKDGQGSSSKPRGYKCAACGLAADTGALISAVRQTVLERKIKDLQAEMA